MSSTLWSRTRMGSWRISILLPLRGYTDPPGPCEIYGVDPNLRTPYVTNWNIDIQRAITNNLSIDIGYVGNHSSNLLGKINVNQTPPGVAWNTPFTSAQANAAGLDPADGGLTAAQVCL